MKQFIIFTLCLFSFSNITIAQNDLLINTYNRQTTTLNGNWNYIIDPYETGYYNYRRLPFDQQKQPWKDAFFLNSKPENISDRVEYDFDNMDSLNVPGDWNTQKQELLYYEGTLWYKKSFDYKLDINSKRLFVYFEASNYKTEVYLNGQKLGTHVGGFTPFNFEITDNVKEKDNYLIIKVDNKRLKEGVPTLNTDWWNYGGLTRDVKLVETNKTFIQDYMIQLDPEDSKIISGFMTLNGTDKGNKTITLEIKELDVSKELTTDANGQADFKITNKNIIYWSDKNPKLYDVNLSVDKTVLKDQIGFRTISTQGKNILLNGESIFLKGISIHEESLLRDGRAYSEEDAKTLLNMAQDLGCNYVRLAHYPHNEHMVRLADQMGILVWEENPVYWTIDWENKATYANAKNQLSELIYRDKNRASVIIWSMANETPTSDARNLFLKRLAAHTRELDPTRLISAALEQKDYKGNTEVRTIEDPFADVVDVLSFNEYIGWYDGLPEKCSRITWKIDQDKPVLISEFGAGAKQGLFGSIDQRWTEDFQEHLYIETLKMISKIDQVQGMSPWILVDFKSPGRHLPKIQDGWNRKGLISDDGIKKKAFFVLQDFYLRK